MGLDMDIKLLYQMNSTWNRPIKEQGITIAIIGSGARGLSVLERIVAFARAGEFPCPVTVKVFDRNAFGPGCHATDQPDHLLVNTIASQITIFSDHTVQGSGLALEGPSFYEWLCDQMSDTGVAPDPNGYYPRSRLGEYLAWGFQYLCSLAPATVTITTVTQAVIAASPTMMREEATWHLQTEAGGVEVVDYLFLTTGHEQATSCQEASEQRLFSAYPLDNATQDIQTHETVAVEGLGLSTCDVLSMLTIGRGGQFFRDQSGQLHYQASQREPRIIGFSRSGLPLSARAYNQKEVREQYKAHFLTRLAISQLKNQHGQLDFRAHVLPLLLADMELVYSKAYIQKYQGFTAAHHFSNLYLTLPAAQRQSLVAKYILESDRFDWDVLANPIPPQSLCSQSQFRDWLNEYMQEDLRCANEGNISNPLKAACDVLRDVRDNLRYAVDFAGLTEDSHRWFIQTFLPIMNRLAVGPPKIRLEEMMALQAAGILKLDLGPNPHWHFDIDRNRFVIQGQFEQVEAHVLIRSRIAMPLPQASSNRLVRQLVTDGVARPFMNGQFFAGGLDVSPDLNLISRTDSIYRNFWVLGTPSEGAKFYTFILPRPFVNSTALWDADRVVQSLCHQVHQQVTNHSLDLVKV
jgi:uncharacterized NAD(P)/FAD-binding protein YdhS